MAIRLGLAVVVAVVLMAFLSPWISPHDAEASNVLNRLKPPAWITGNWEYPLGTDELGRDIVSRLIWGARVSLIVGVIAVCIGGPVGVTVGLFSGFFGGRVDQVLMRIADIQLSIPAVLFAIAVIAVLGPGLKNVIVVLGINSWMVYARLVRGQVLSIREKEYVEAIRCLGGGNGRILLKHIFPNAIPPAIVVATFGVANMIIAEATLSFLGLGVQPPTPTWGGMLNSGRTYIDTAWWLATFPGVMIFITVMGVNLIGDFIRDVLDPTVDARL